MQGYDIQHDYDFGISHLGYVIERSPDPTWRIVDLVNDEYHILAFALDGKAQYQVDEKEYSISRGDLLFFPKGLKHSATSDREEPWQFCYTAFDLEFFDKASEYTFRSLDRINSSINSSQLSAMFTELTHLWQAKRSGFRIRCRSIIMELLYLLIQADNDGKNESLIPHLHQIDKVAKKIEADFSRSFSIEELAGFANLSPSYFRRLFREATGYTPIQYQNKVKVHKAKDLLLSGEANVSEAAYAVGFENVFYFSRLFKKVSGVSPSEYTRR